MSKTTIAVRYSGRTSKIALPSLEMAEMTWDVLEPHYSMVGERPTMDDQDKMLAEKRARARADLQKDEQ